MSLFTIVVSLQISNGLGCLAMESAAAVVLCMLAATAGDLVFGATSGDPIDAFDYLTVLALPSAPKSRPQ